MILALVVRTISSELQLTWRVFRPTLSNVDVCSREPVSREQRSLHIHSMLKGVSLRGTRVTWRVEDVPSPRHHREL